VIGRSRAKKKWSNRASASSPNPSNFIAQPVIQLSTHPTIIRNGTATSMKVAPRHIDFRPFVLFGATPRVLAGGLTRVALREGSADRQFVARRRQQRYLGARKLVLRRIADHLFWTARNLERAEWRARLVDVNYHLLIETPPRDSQPWTPLLAIFGETDNFKSRYPDADEASMLISSCSTRKTQLDSQLHPQRAHQFALAAPSHLRPSYGLDLNTL